MHNRWLFRDLSRMFRFATWLRYLKFPLKYLEFNRYYPRQKQQTEPHQRNHHLVTHRKMYLQLIRYMNRRHVNL